jgi:hypothetical protein
VEAVQPVPPVTARIDVESQSSLREGCQAWGRGDETRFTDLVCPRSADIHALVLMVPLAQEEARYKCHLLFRVVDGLPHCRELPQNLGSKSRAFGSHFAATLLPCGFGLSIHVV